EEKQRQERAGRAVMSSLVGRAKEFVAGKIAQIPKPEASLTGVSVKSLSRDSALFHSDVSVSNPYSHSLPICEVSYTLKSAGRLASSSTHAMVVASGTLPDPGSLPASVVTKLEVPVKVPYNFLVSLVRDIGRDWDIDYELQVGLTIDLPIVGDFTIPLSTKGELKLPTLSDIF
ncbi:hypothetical protein GW17_00054955, partial [Ensete ventricosum]